jgi:uncharacterized protein (TIGR02466 family)
MIRIQKEECFSNLILTCDLENVNNNLLKSFCIDKVKFEETEPNQSILSNYELQTPILQNISHTIKNCTNYFKEQFDFKNQLDLTLTKAWINLNTCNFTLRPHLHIDSVFSGVYYVSCTENNSKLTFINPVTAHPYVITQEMVETYNKFNSALWSFQPKNGMLIMFPSWLVHCIENTENIEDRISIAFNIGLRK